MTPPSGPTSTSLTAPPGHTYPYPWVRLRSGTWHAFIYQRMLGQVDPAARAGDVVAVYDKAGQFFGHAFYHDKSQIGLRMLSYDPAPVDDDFFRAKLATALDWRGKLLADTADTNACRLVHSEGDGLSGLIAERFDSVIAIEVFSLGIYRRLALLQRLLTELTGVTQFVVRADERIERIEGFKVRADREGPDSTVIREHGLKFRIDLRTGHKTGFFCDQRDNRRRLAQFTRGASVLDVCCYSGGFGIYAKAKGEAGEVTGVDLDEDAIELAKKNANLNNLRISHVHADAFAYLRQMQTNGRQFDVVVLDPPKFIANPDDRGEGSRKYVDLNTLGLSVVKPGGLILTCSCSGSVSRDDFLGMVNASVGRVRRQLQIVDYTGAAPDHPVMSNCPESAYLKAVWARVF